MASTLFAKKSISDLQAEAGSKNTLKRTLGPFQLIALGIGAIIGAGLFSLTGLAAATNAGPAVAISMVIASVGCAFAGLCYSEFSCMIPVSGSAYTYTYATMGEWLAWIMGWSLVLEYAIGAATVSISWSGYVVSLLHDFGINLPAQLVSSPLEALKMSDGTVVQGIINLPAIFIVAVISTLLMVGIKESVRANAVIVVVKVAVVVVLITVGWFYINRANYMPFIPANTGEFGHFGLSGILKGAATIFFAYIGFDAVSTAAQEARNPQKDMPIGIIGSLLICAVLYVLFSIVLTGMVPYTGLNVSAPVAVAIDVTGISWLKVMVKLGVICGFTSVILVMLLGQSRVFFTMSRDGLVPKIFSDIHPKFRTPYKSSLVFGILVAVLGAFLPLEIVGHMTSIGTLFAFIIVCAGVWIMRHTHPDVPRPFRVPLVPLVPILGILWNFAMMFSLGVANWTRLIVWTVLGQLIFFFYSRKHSKVQGGNARLSRSDKALGLANVGFLAGGVVAFLLRPATADGAKASFNAVLSLGSGITDPALAAVALTSFYYVLAGVTVGSIAGAFAGYAAGKNNTVIEEEAKSLGD